MIIGARLAGVFVSRTANLVVVSRTNLLKIMTAYTRDSEPMARVPLMARDIKFWQTAEQNEERPVFQDDNAPVHWSRCVQTWYYEHDDEAEYLT
ncbi:hypothetical protein TNCV_3268971 [Trichonephila clavipes]|nr:hypothetical protein TNCV_3268971 [Trichonephila clavipes]